MVTASAALENGYGLDSVWPNPHELDLPLTDGTIQNFGGETCPGGATTTLLTAFTNSCNVIFGEVGLKLERGEALRRRRTRSASARPIRPSETGCLEPTIPFTIPFATGRFPVAELLRGQRPARRHLRDRTGQRPGQPAADGARGVGHREPRRDDGAPAGDADPRPAGTRHPGVRPASSTASRSRRRPRRRCATMMVSVVASGTGTARADPRLRGRGQDRHRAARRAGLGTPRVVRLLRAGGTGRGPDDRGRGYRLGRRRPRERGDRRPGGRADRAAGPRGVPGGLGRGVR